MVAVDKRGLAEKAYEAYNQSKLRVYNQRSSYTNFGNLIEHSQDAWVAVVEAVLAAANSEVGNSQVDSQSTNSDDNSDDEKPLLGLARARRSGRRSGAIAGMELTDAVPESDVASEDQLTTRQNDPWEKSKL